MQKIYIIGLIPILTFVMVFLIDPISKTHESIIKLEQDFPPLEANNNIILKPKCVNEILNNDIKLNLQDCRLSDDEIKAATSVNDPYCQTETKYCITTSVDIITGSKRKLINEFANNMINIDYGYRLDYSIKTVSGDQIMVSTNDEAIGLLGISNSNPRKIEKLFNFPIGNRCNGGYPELSVWDNGLYYTTEATFFRLLNPKDNRDWREEKQKWILDDVQPTKDNKKEVFHGLLPNKDLADCLICCAGKIFTKMQDVEPIYSTLGVIVDLEYLPKINKNRNYTKAEQCFVDHLYSQNLNQYIWKRAKNDYTEYRMFSIEEWDRILNEFIEVCPN